MIYSQDIDRKCAVCVFAKLREGEIYCTEKKQTMPVSADACKKFSYDILKRHTRRMRRLKTDFNPKDFTL